jgi:hypothetical protein
MEKTKYPIPMDIMKMDILMGTNYIEKWDMGLYRPIFREGWEAFFDKNEIAKSLNGDNPEWISGWEAAGKLMGRY